MAAHGTVRPVAHWMELPDSWVPAPDGSQVRVLLRAGDRGGMAHFRLQPHQVSAAVQHRDVDELWYVTAGSGEMVVGDGDPFRLQRDVAVHVPPRTRFQFRADDDGLDVVGVTMPPWSGDGEALVAEPHWRGSR
jgi:mannose-6-phosphate isomerase-like protein (cupin superfamily)